MARKCYNIGPHQVADINSPAVSLNETTIDKCSTKMDCSSCTFDVDCGYCYVAVASDVLASNASCVEKSTAKDAYAAYGRCSEANITKVTHIVGLDAKKTWGNLDFLKVGLWPCPHVGNFNFAIWR